MAEIRSRRERPAKRALSRAAVVEAAVAIMRAEGLARVTMRRVAAELDTGQASLYVYVRNVADLHAAILDNELASVGLNRRGAWRTQLAAIMNSYAEVLYDNPGLAVSALSARPTGAHYLALIDKLLALLQAGGIPDDRAGWGVDLLLLRATASAAEHGVRDQSPDADDEEAELGRALREADPSRYPHLARLAGELVSGTGRDRSTWALDVLLAGIAATPLPAAKRSDR